MSNIILNTIKINHFTLFPLQGDGLFVLVFVVICYSFFVKVFNNYLGTEDPKP